MKLIHLDYDYHNDIKQYPCIQKYSKFISDGYSPLIYEDETRVLITFSLCHRTNIVYFIINAVNGKLLSATYTFDDSASMTCSYYYLNGNMLICVNKFSCIYSAYSSYSAYIIGVGKSKYRELHNKSNLTRYIKIMCLKSRLLKLLS